jgi:hypothetical protein
LGLVNISTAVKAITSSALLRIDVKLNKTPVPFVLDCGAEVNVIDESTYEAVGKPPIRKCDVQAKLYDNSRRSFLGKGVGKFEFDGISTELEFYLAKRGSMNLLSVEAMDKFGLLDQIKERIAHVQINLASRLASKTQKGGENAQSSNFVASLQSNFPNVFREDLGLCTKMKAHLAVKPDATPIFRRARPVPYNAKDTVDFTKFMTFLMVGSTAAAAFRS